MYHSLFIGRTRELSELKSLYTQHLPRLVVVKGRRRIGKSRLISEFAKTIPMGRFLNFAGLTPINGVSSQEQRDAFTRQLSSLCHTPFYSYTDWTDVFEYLSIHIQIGDIIVFDEISWMGSDDQTFIPKLKVWWDKQTIPIMLFFCGSVSTWIEENIIKSTSFFGRINLTITLEPLSIPESALFLKKIGMQASDYEMYKLLSVLGGIPWYLEQCNPQYTADETIKKLTFTKNGLLVTEFDNIFHDLFNSKGMLYKTIINSLTDGTKTLAEIGSSIPVDTRNKISELLENLITAGFVAKQTLWSFKTTQPLHHTLYRIADPYIRFYLKVIDPHKEAILNGDFDPIPLSTIPGIDTHMGLQLEILLLQHRALLLQKIGISPIDIVRSGQYRQTKTSTQQGCQIDYLIQTKTNGLYLCEFKFKKRELGTEIIDEMKEKIARLKVPKGFAKIPLLFHSGGVSYTVGTNPFFYRIIDIMDLLYNNNLS